jgi:hypothetical protein
VRDDLLEREVDVAVDQPGAGGRGEHRSGRLRRDGPVAASEIGPQSRDRGWVKRDLARLAELAVAHHQQSVGEVDVVAVQADRLTDSHPGDREQPDQRAHRRCAVWRRDHPCAVHQRQNLRVGIEVRDRAPRPPRQQISARYLVRGVDRVQMGGEAADDRQPLVVPVRAGRWRAGRPLKRQLRGDQGLVALGHPPGELGQQLPRASELVSHRAPDLEIPGEVLLERAHALAPGHGRESKLNAALSTLA